ncbi:MAG TPA: hypothetical protein VKU00_10840, partial [Chthonomonadaceae bacterium]|nr:hypothetical protein [Chthonomonadaceae bacterium]
DTGFTPGKSYNYLVSAIILRQVPSSGGTGNTGGGTGNTGGGTGNGSGNGNTGGTEFIETDPAISGLVTPITPVLLITPPVAAANINAKAFSPTWNSRVGADLFQLEISTDRNFKTPSLIYTQQVFSTAPLTDGLPQGVPATIDLTVIPQLLASPAFAAFVAQSNGTTPSPPQIFWRVGARFDGDNPGPVHWISGRADDPDRTFRFVYDTPSYFYPAPLPPPPPGKGSAAATALTKRYAGRAGFVVPTAGIAGTTRSQSRPRVLSPQEILSGGARTRN